MGLAAVQVPYHMTKVYSTRSTHCGPGVPRLMCSAKLQELPGYDSTTGTGAAIVASTGYLQRSWLLRHPVVGMYLEEPVVTTECINAVHVSALVRAWPETQHYAPTQQAALQSISDLAAIFTGGLGTSAPLVTLDPVSQTVTVGQTVNFTAAATGTPTPTVIWQVSTNGGVSLQRHRLGDVDHAELRDDRLPQRLSVPRQVHQFGCKRDHRDCHADGHLRPFSTGRHAEPIEPDGRRGTAGDLHGRGQRHADADGAMAGQLRRRCGLSQYRWGNVHDAELPDDRLP